MKKVIVLAVTAIAVVSAIAHTATVPQVKRATSAHMAALDSI